MSGSTTGLAANRALSLLLLMSGSAGSRTWKLRLSNSATPLSGVVAWSYTYSIAGAITARAEVDVLFASAITGTTISKILVSSVTPSVPTALPAGLDVTQAVYWELTCQKSGTTATVGIDGARLEIKA